MYSFLQLLIIACVVLLCAPVDGGIPHLLPFFLKGSKLARLKNSFFSFKILNIFIWVSESVSKEATGGTVQSISNSSYQRVPLFSRFHSVFQQQK